MSLRRYLDVGYCPPFPEDWYSDTLCKKSGRQDPICLVLIVSFQKVLHMCISSEDSVFVRDSFLLLDNSLKKVIVLVTQLFKESQ